MQKKNAQKVYQTNKKQHLCLIRPLVKLIIPLNNFN